MDQSGPEMENLYCSSIAITATDGGWALKSVEWRSCPLEFQNAIWSINQSFYVRHVGEHTQELIYTGTLIQVF